MDSGGMSRADDLAFSRQFEREAMSTQSEIGQAETRLLNAFNLIKNGKQITHLKFDEFKKLMDKTVNHRGEFN